MIVLIFGSAPVVTVIVTVISVLLGLFAGKFYGLVPGLLVAFLWPLAVAKSIWDFVVRKEIGD